MNTTVDGNKFENPIGLSAGFDKNGEMLSVVHEFGFGFEEIGSITGEHCDGNAKPRVHRAKTTGTGSINVFNGLNNFGAKVLRPRIEAEMIRTQANAGISAAMLNFQGSIAEGIADYLKTVREFAGVGKFLVMNISCPNTVQGEPFIDPVNLAMLLKETVAVRKETNDTKPMYVKISPELSDKEMEDILRVSNDFGVNGIVTTNLTKISHKRIQDQLSRKRFKSIR